MNESNIQEILLLIPPMLLALTVHECAHAWVAWKLGDPTAKMLGRVTLNPIKHLDPMGTLVFILSGMFGWAKPVPVNHRNFNDPTRHMMYVSLAGPVTNLSLAAISALLFRVILIVADQASPGLINILLPVIMMLKTSIIINVALGVFNLIPIPPLDGSKILYHFLPYQQALAFSKVERYGFIILIFLIFTGTIGKILWPVVSVTVSVLMGGA